MQQKVALLAGSEIISDSALFNLLLIFWAADRLARYEANFAVLTTGMADLGFRLYLSDQAQVDRALE